MWESSECFEIVLEVSQCYGNPPRVSELKLRFFLESLGQFKVFCECALDVFFVVFFDIIGEVFFVQLLLFCCYQLNFSAISSRSALNCR